MTKSIEMSLVKKYLNSSLNKSFYKGYRLILASKMQFLRCIPRNRMRLSIFVVFGEANWVTVHRHHIKFKRICLLRGQVIDQLFRHSLYLAFSLYRLRPVSVRNGLNIQMVPLAQPAGMPRWERKERLYECSSLARTITARLYLYISLYVYKCHVKN